MGEFFDQLSKALVSDASRRSALGGLLAGSAALFPWTAEAKDRKKRKKKKKKRERRRVIEQSLEFCQEWCQNKFAPDAGAVQSCISAAGVGQGACYSPSEQGPGFFCLELKACGKKEFCCPSIIGGNPVTSGACCPNGTVCAFVNSTSTGDLCVA